MTPEIMRQYLAAHAPELEVVELVEAHTTDYISREWKVVTALLHPPQDRHIDLINVPADCSRSFSI